MPQWDDIDEEKVSDIDKVTDDEVYLIKEDGNKQRICGAKRSGIDEKFPCISPAGKGTSHEGIGKCKLHDTSVTANKKSKNTYEIIVDPQKKKTLLDHLVDVSDLRNEHHTNLDSEIEALEALIGHNLQNIMEEEDISTNRIVQISKLIKDLAAVKNIKINALKKEKLDSEIVAKFIKNIIDIIKNHSTADKVQQIIADIIQKVISPMMFREEITKKDLREFKTLIE